MTDSLRRAVGGLLSPDALLPEDESRGWCPGDKGTPVVVVPNSEEEVGKLLAQASQEGWRVLPAGEGTWLDGGGPAEFDLIVSTRRLKGMEEYEPADLTFTAGAGITLSSLEEATEAHGQWLPVNPPGGRLGSLGAAVSLGVGGSLRQLYGPPRDHILGLSMVSGDGRLLRWGGRVVKNVAGFDLTRLCIGSWGSLGVITSVSARLFPLPESDVTVILRGPEAGSLLLAALSMARSGLPIAALELLDPLDNPAPVPNGVGDAGRSGNPGAGLVVRLLGSRPQVAEMEARIRKEYSQEGMGWVRQEGESSRIFQEACDGWEDGSDLVLRMALLPSRLEELFLELDGLRATMGEIEAGQELEVRAAAHVGAGVLRVAVSGVESSGKALEGWAAALVALRERLEESGGTLTLSKAPRPLAREVGSWGAVGGEAELLGGIKSQFDPQGILAPGRFVV
jgi:glycolate oxidase FAD binding subunit